ncbi:MULTISPECIES: CTB family bacteriocin [Cyanophyceae]|jgi:hypothetical protein|uniref:Uncharacterized protein n=1 Tax=Nodularia spumigena CENA596 TaxID=1819295 RepID=A0A166I6L1_NODSP|nr:MULTISPECIES: CTB family bacteriocin [Cyanophyceae]MDB9356471.1 CTB family bacteriocin [Nodularia spumigena CS-587/03]KZL47968.1 hypothetical protein A2T98_20490 [Nodularia spumigena CENA596]MDB9302802.1 CTB family bacteriocin [Nodularia spumigena CS-591/12]MDB9340902.1 CTB family bacteriocin [Nodularia spumigena CS-589/07]MDB9400507.1 CTB family bacteriocin [Microcystis aeruginosa CS-567/02-A1]
MSNPLFTEVSSEQQEIVAGGFNFGSTFFSGLQETSFTQTISTPGGGSQSTSETGNVIVLTFAETFNGINLPANFFSAPAPQP